VAQDSQSASVNREGTLRFMLRALRYRNYRLFFTGQLASLVGTWLTMLATSWLVYRLARASYPDQAALILGVVGFVGQVPIFLLSPWAGVWIDRWSRHRVLVATQSLSMLQSFALAALALTGVIQIWHILILNALQGVVNAFDVTARQAFIVELVENRDDLSGAIALNSSMFHSARLVGPAVAGWLISISSEGICFLIDGFSYLAVLLALLAMRLPARPTTTPHESARQAFAEGMRYSFGFPPIRSLLLMVGMTSLLGMSQSVLMPLFADRVLGGDEKTLGLLLASSGFGALVGSLYLASRRSVVGLGRVIAWAATAMGLGMIAFSFSTWLPLSLPILLVVGGALVVELASANTVLQTIVDDDKRSRVMGLFAVAVMGMAPFGSLLAGTVANFIGAPRTMAFAGIISVATAVGFRFHLPSLRPFIRPIYIKKGILPQVAEGMQAASNLAATPHE
jgi:MFS family permease